MKKIYDVHSVKAALAFIVQRPHAHSMFEIREVAVAAVDVIHDLEHQLRQIKRLPIYHYV